MSASLGILMFCAAPAIAATPAWELISVHGPTEIQVTPPVNQVTKATIKAIGGRFDLGYEGEEALFKYDATALEVQQKLEKFEAIGPGNVRVTGGPGDETGSTPYTVEFVGLLGGRELEELEVSSEGLKLGKGREGEARGEVKFGSSDTVVYQLMARNVGAAPTSGPVTVKDTLPEGLSDVSGAGESWSCSTLARTVTCQSSGVVNADGEAPVLALEGVVEVANVSNGEQLTNTPEISGGGAASATAKPDVGTVGAGEAPFGIQHFTAATYGQNGETYTQAGGHPFAATTSFFFDSIAQIEPNGERLMVPNGNIKDAVVKLPAGFVGNPTATPQCTQAEFTESLPGGPKQGGACKPETQVGSASVFVKALGQQGQHVAVYNLVPPPGVPAEFGFIYLNVPVRLDAKLVREPATGEEPGEYRITVVSPDVNEYGPLIGITLSLWGIPQEETHRPERFINNKDRGAPDPEPEKPFLTNPADCATEVQQPPVTTLTIDRWQEPGSYDADGNPLVGEAPWSQVSYTSPRVTGCEALSFQPAISFAPSVGAEGTTQADEPSGYTFTLKIPQNESPSGLATPELRSTTVTLPAGVTISPSAANGLQACSAAQIGLESTKPGSCPSASQVGEVKIKTPLLHEELSGRVYIGAPGCSPCSATQAEHGEVFRLFIEAEGSGVRVKLRGTASTNQATGQITTTFAGNPQLPFELLTLTLHGGPRASLANPSACGSYSASAVLSSWAEGVPPETQSSPAQVLAESPFAISSDGGGGTCPASRAFVPGFQAGTANSQAGAYSPLDVTFTRSDHEQFLSGITVSTPPGLLGKIAGVVRCGEPQASTGGCPAASQIATATSEAGSGPDPYAVSGPVYLTESYKGAPFGLSIAVPAVAGPFNLGTVVVRAAIAVDRSTSAITITSDPLPQSIDGVPFRLQRVKVDVTRPEFMFNPTSCEPQTLHATLTGAPVVAGESPVTTTRTAPFTATGCGGLAFKPKLSAATSSVTGKVDGASFSVKVEVPRGDSNIHKVELQLPERLPSRIETLHKACLAKVFATERAKCPRESVVGSATARTPLLNQPLTGPAYLVSLGGAEFPNLVFLLKGENGIEIELIGSTHITKGVTYSRFETVPDAPVTSFETTLPAGPYSVLGAFIEPYNEICEVPQSQLVAPTKIVAQDGAVVTQKTNIHVVGCGPTIQITRVKISKRQVTLTVRLGKAGTVRLSGANVKATSRTLDAGTQTITAALSSAGRRMVQTKRGKITIRVSVSAGGKTASKSVKVKA